MSDAGRSNQTPWWWHVLALVFGLSWLGAALGLIQEVRPEGPNAGLNPFNFTGPHFLGFYAELIVVTFFAAAGLRWLGRRPHDDPPTNLDLGPYDVAYLAGGERLATYSALANLVRTGAVIVDRTSHQVKRGDEPPTDAPELEKALHAQLDPHLGTAVSAVPQHAAAVLREIRGRLEEMALVPSRHRFLQSYWLSLALVFALFTFGAIKVAVGISRNKPVLFLSLMAAGALVVGLLTFARPARRSGRGERALRMLRDQHRALETTARRDPERLTSDDLGLAIGLYGLGILTVGPLADLRATVQQSGAASSGWYGCGTGGSCGGGDGGGAGCGGGGCGGCGGGGCGG